jgi:hypothetical protein
MKNRNNIKNECRFIIITVISIDVTITIIIIHSFTIVTITITITITITNAISAIFIAITIIFIINAFVWTISVNAADTCADTSVFISALHTISTTIRISYAIITGSKFSIAIGSAT